MFAADLNGKWRGDFVASRNRLGVKERVFFQSGRNGDAAIVTLEGEDPAAAFAQFGQGDDEFTIWFVDRVKALHGFDLRQPMPHALPELVIES